MRWIQPTTRRVHFSEQVHTSLDELSGTRENDDSARDAWGMVFQLRQHLVDEVNVNAFLSKNIRKAERAGMFCFGTTVRTTSTSGAEWTRSDL